MKKRATRVMALLMGIMMLMSAFVIPVSASSTGGSTEGEPKKNVSSISDVEEVLNSITYSEYRKKYAEVAKGTAEYVINATDYDTEKTTAKAAETK